MSWSIYCTGTVAGTMRYVSETKPHMEVDKVAFETARQFILDELAKVKTTGVAVEASGHAERINRIVVNDLPLVLE